MERKTLGAVPRIMQPYSSNYLFLAPKLQGQGNCIQYRAHGVYLDTWSLDYMEDAVVL